MVVDAPIRLRAAGSSNAKSCSIIPQNNRSIGAPNPASATPLSLNKLDNVGQASHIAQRRIRSAAAIVTVSTRLALR